jgi:hypothetical protein
MVYGEDCPGLGGSNPPLQILQPILVALGRVVRERSMNRMPSHPILQPLRSSVSQNPNQT